MGKLGAAVAEEIKEYVGHEVWDPVAGKFSVKIQHQVEELIQKAVAGAVKKLVVTSFDDLVKEQCKIAEQRLNRYELKLLAEANERINKATALINEELDKRMDAAFEERVEREINRRLIVAKEMR